jgi:hypothetical protein
MYTDLEKNIEDLAAAMRSLTRRMEERLERERSEAILRAGMRRSVRDIPPVKVA